MRCACDVHDTKLVVLTGGPGAGKTAVLEVVRRTFCEHVVVLPEAASILFGGGFPRHDTDAGRRAAQLAIFAVQRAIEGMIVEERRAAIALCDRGTLDGLAYWPASMTAACDALGIRRDAELARYAAIIHLRPPPAEHGYDHTNPIRNETAAEAARIDARIDAAWAGHPRRIVVSSEEDFVRKLARTVEAIRSVVPECCRKHPIPELHEA